MADGVEQQWWRSELNPKGLTQGDVLAGVPVITAHAPLTYLGRDTWPAKGKTYWPQTAALAPFRTDSTGLMIGRGRASMALVVSHSCDLDKKPEEGRVLVALVAPLESISSPATRASILEQKRIASMPLPDVPGKGALYADLRCIAYVERTLVPESARVCSMTDAALVRLRSQLIAFFTRLDPAALLEQLAKDVNQE